MTKGEAVRCVVDYDLFGININGEEGCFLQEDKHTKKSLICFWVNEEWAELTSDQFESINKPGYVPVKNKKFISLIKTLHYTFPT